MFEVHVWRHNEIFTKFDLIKPFLDMLTVWLLIVKFILSMIMNIVVPIVLAYVQVLLLCLFICTTQKCAEHSGRSVNHTLLSCIRLQFFIFSVRLWSVLRGHSVLFIPATTANDFRLRRIFIPDIIHYIIFLS